MLMIKIKKYIVFEFSKYIRAFYLYTFYPEKVKLVKFAHAVLGLRFL